MTEETGYYIRSDHGRTQDDYVGAYNLRKSHNNLSKDARTVSTKGKAIAKDIGRNDLDLFKEEQRDQCDWS